MAIDELVSVCREYDAETDFDKRHTIGIRLDDLASMASEKEIKRAIRILKGIDDEH